MKKPVLATAMLVTALTASSAFAWGSGDKGHYNNSNDGKRCSMHSSMMDGKGGRHHGMMLKEQMDRNYTADQIRTLTEARLIRRGNPNVKVGDITSTSEGYKVRIVTQDNSLVKEYELAKNGMPLDRYNAMQKRMEKWEERRNS